MMLLKTKELLGNDFDNEIIEFSSQTGEGADRIRQIFEEINSQINL